MTNANHAQRLKNALQSSRRLVVAVPCVKHADCAIWWHVSQPAGPVGKTGQTDWIWQQQEQLEICFLFRTLGLGVSRMREANLHLVVNFVILIFKMCANRRQVGQIITHNVSPNWFGHSPSRTALQSTVSISSGLLWMQHPFQLH